MRKKILNSRNKFEDLIQMAKNSEEGMDFLYSSLSNLVEPLQKITRALRVENRMNMNLSLVVKFQKRSIYIHQMMSTREGDPKELRRARRRRRRKLEVRVKVIGRVENISNKGIMMHAIAQTMLLADISIEQCTIVRPQPWNAS